MPKAFASCLAVALLASGCVSASSSTTSNFGADTAMGQIQNRGVLRVGILGNSPPFAFVQSGSPRGFEVGLARVVARALKVRLHVTTGSQKDLITETNSGDLDMSFPGIPITTAEVRPPKDPTKAGLPAYWPEGGVVFVDPYFVGHQRLLAPIGLGIKQVADLDRHKVCSAVNPQTEVDLSHLRPSIDVVSRAEPEGCVALLRRGKVKAATSSEPGLLSMLWDLSKTSAHPSFGLVGDQLSTEGYGVMIPNGNVPGLLSYLNETFASASDDGTWSKLYRRWLAPYEPKSTPASPPTASANEMASLFPNI